jgi:hypothetical protein
MPHEVETNPHAEEVTMELALAMEESIEANRRLMDSLRIVVVALTTIMVALAIAAGGLGLAIQQRVIPPPEVDAQLGRLHLVAFTTGDPACALYS